MQSPTAYIYFKIHGDFNPFSLAAQIPLKPDECVAKHTRGLGNVLPKTSMLDYARQETFDELADIYKLAESVVDILEPHQPALAAGIREHGAVATFQVVMDFPIYEEVPTPPIGFSERVISFIAATGASIDIDTYRATKEWPNDFTKSTPGHG